MNLQDLAFTHTEAGESRRVIDDGSLLDWARLKGTPPREAQIQALQAGILPLRYLRNISALNPAEQIQVCRSRVIICGCGGLGGVLIHLLARLGVGFLRVVDGDVFSEPNLNRQWLCDRDSISRSKALAAQAAVERINPFTEVSACVEMVSDENADGLLSGMDLSLDALDDLPARFVLARRAGHSGIPFIHAAVAGWWGQVSTFLPGQDLDLSAVYGKKRIRDPEEVRWGVLSATPAVVAGLQALEALRLLTGKPPVYSRKLLYFDGESGRMELMPLS